MLEHSTDRAKIDALLFADDPSSTDRGRRLDTRTETSNLLAIGAAASAVQSGR